MSFIDRKVTDGSRWPGMMLAWLGSGLFIAAFFAPTALSGTLDENTDVDHEEENQPGWHSEVDPSFAFDGRLFDIEPSAPPRDAERQSCDPVVDEELGLMCSQ